MRKFFVVLILFIFVSLFALGKGNNKKDKFDLLIKQYEMIDIHQYDYHFSFLSPNQLDVPLYYPSETQAANLWKSSIPLNPWIKDPTKISVGTIIIWNTKDITLYGGKNVITKIGYGECPMYQAYKLLSSPFFYE